MFKLRTDLVAGVAVTVAAMFLAPVAALAQKKPAETQIIKIGKTSVTVPSPDGFCFMDRTKASDLRVFNLVQATVGKTNTLHTILASCASLEKWRSGKQKTLDNMIQVQSLTRLANTKMPPRKTVARQVCQSMGQMKKARTDAIFEEKRQLIKKLSDAIRINETKFVGVLDETDTACYAAVIQRIKTEANTSKVLLVTFATTTVNNKMLYYYRMQRYEAPEQLKSAVEVVRGDVKNLLAANGK